MDMVDANVFCDDRRLTVRRKTFAAWFLFAVVFAPVAIPAEAISGLLFVFTVFYIFASGLKFPRRLLYLIAPMLLFILLGLLGSFQNSPYAVVKDVWYAGKSVLALMAGYMIMSEVRDLRSLIKVFLVAAALSALLHLSRFILDLSLVAESLKDIREGAGKGFFISVLAVSLIAACRHFKLEVFRRPGVMWFILTLSLVSLAMSFSRTFWISLAIMLISIYGLLTLRNMKRLMVLLVFLAVTIGAVMTAPESEQTGPNATLRGKMAYSLKEVMVSNYKSMADINQNWRGYESFRAVTTYLNGSGAQYVAGRGFGTLVDLGIYIRLGGDEKFRYIPTLHNGYMYILVKTGIIGLIIYAYFLLKFILHGRAGESTPGNDLRLAGRLVVALTLVLLATTMVIAGFFNKITLHPALVLLGALLYYIQANKSRLQI